MSNTITHDDKFQRKFVVSEAGDVLDQGSKIKTGIGNLLTVENHLRIHTSSFGVANTIEVRARLINEDTWTTLETITGNATTLVDITTWNIVHFFVTNYDSSPGVINVTGFVKNSSTLPSDVILTDDDGDRLDLLDISGVFSIPTIEQIEPLIQEHLNASVVTAGTPAVITPSSGTIRSMIIQNPMDGPNKNPINKVLLVSWDGITYFSVPNGAFFTAENIKEVDIYIDATTNNTNFELIMEHD